MDGGEQGGLGNFSESDSDYLVPSDNERGEEEDEEYFGDPCHEIEHSILFFGILIIFLGSALAYSVLLCRRYWKSI